MAEAAPTSASEAGDPTSDAAVRREAGAVRYIYIYIYICIHICIYISSIQKWCI